MGNLHTVALGRLLSLAIPPRVGKNEEQLCAAATTARSLVSLAPSHGLAGVRLRAIEMGDQPLNPMSSEEPKRPLLL